ncbi:hypothetical protein MBLNU459_g6098t1 [Dothideomycetes sp. NU459]
MVGLQHVYELEGDVPPTSPSSTTFSDASLSLKPRPLNFSRPRPLCSSLPSADTQASHRRQDSIIEDSAAALPPIVRTYASSVDLEDLHHGDDRDSVDEAVPPPIRTHSNWKDRDNVDEAVPPPIRTHADWNDASDRDGGYRVNTAPGPSARNSASRTPREWIYKPYVDSLLSSCADSIASSLATVDNIDETHNTKATNDLIWTDDYNATNARNTIDADEDEAQRISDNSVAVALESDSDFAFDGRFGWQPRPKLSSVEAQRQRWMPPPPPSNGSGGGAGTIHQTTSADSRENSTASSGQRLMPTVTRGSTASSSSSSSVGARPAVPPRIPRIVKRTSVDQVSEHMNAWQGESMSDRGSISSNEWTSSDHDTSGLSIEQIHKLKKKGINPALYVEMKNARKGKSKWISPLQGNSFLM